MLDTKIFEEIPNLREMIGNYGEPIVKVRPTGRELKKWYNAEADDVPVRAWAIVDHGGWRRDLLPMEVTSNTFDQRNGRVVMFQRGPFGMCANVLGCLLVVPILGLVVVGWSVAQLLSSSWTLTATCILDAYGPREPYLPLDDFDL